MSAPEKPESVEYDVGFVVKRAGKCRLQVREVLPDGRRLLQKCLTNLPAAFVRERLAPNSPTPHATFDLGGGRMRELVRDRGRFWEVTDPGDLVTMTVDEITETIADFGSYGAAEKVGARTSHPLKGARFMPRNTA